ncbi:MAG: HAMP domain-containing histidine kinase [Gemmatimonadetes bacterium]|nr:HAMP domain-containing histidine kinase [Gemmatimonadota bacterium]
MTPLETTRPATERSLTEALAAFDEGAKLLETAYRELWATRESERGGERLLAAERIRDLCHELRNPLGGVSGLVALLQREHDKTGATERARRLTAGIHDGLAALQSVLDAQVLEDEERADAGAIAEETTGLALAENVANGGNVRFRVDAPEGVELPVPAGHFREILSNLIRNAADAAGPDGQVDLCLESSLDAVTVWVDDNGRGLPPVPDDVLFRRGFSTKGTGRGRGLALVVELVEEAGGSVHFGRQETGTRVRVRLPRRNA